MQRSRLSRFLFVALGIGLAAPSCSTDNYTPGGVQARSFGVEWAEAYCGKLLSCCTTAELENLTGPDTDYASCRIIERGVWEGYVEPLVARGEAAGVLEFNEKLFDGCLEALRANDCASYSERPSLSLVPLTFCDEAFVGKVDVGGSCFSDFECKTRVCEFQDTTHDTIGTCRSPVAPGESCNPGKACVKGFYCESPTITCVAKRDDGAPCSSNTECASSVCLGGQCGRACQAAAGVNFGSEDPLLESLVGPWAIAECQKTSECCTDEDLSHMFLTSKNSLCFAISSGIFGSVLSGLHHDEMEGKITIDRLALASCCENAGARSCEEFSKFNSLCEQAVVPRVENGGSCTMSYQCITGYCGTVAGGGNACAQRAIEGAACSDDDGCEEGLYCESVTQTCEVKLGPGSACTSTAQCWPATCELAGSGTCITLCDGT